MAKIFQRLQIIFKLYALLRLAFQENQNILKSEKRVLISLPDARYLTDAIGKIFQKNKVITSWKLKNEERGITNGLSNLWRKKHKRI